MFKQKLLDALPTTFTSWITLLSAFLLVVVALGLSIVKGSAADGELQILLTYATLFLGIQKTGSTVSDYATKKYTDTSSSSK